MSRVTEAQWEAARRSERGEVWTRARRERALWMDSQWISSGTESPSGGLGNEAGEICKPRSRRACVTGLSRVAFIQGCGRPRGEAIKEPFVEKRRT